MTRAADVYVEVATEHSAIIEQARRNVVHGWNSDEDSWVMLLSQALVDIDDAMRSELTDDQ